VMAEVEVRRLRQELAEVTQRLDEAEARAARPAQPPVITESTVETGPVALPGRTSGIEETELDVPPVVPTSEAAEPSEPVTTTPPQPEEPASTAAPTAGAADSTEQPQALYDRGYAFFHQKRYADAESHFRRFLERYSDHPLADNAQFWIGESRYARGDFSSALAAFSATVERYPNGNKVADAMLKAGKCLESMGQTAEAIATYEAIEARFPDTVVASTAASRLAALRER
ncbi:MAG: tol-pal system protein YbgF, partial [Acidobacteriota bacterium]